MSVDSVHQKQGRDVFVAWMPFQRRQVSMAPLLGFENVFLPIPPAHRALRPFQYVKHALRTLRVLKRKRPRVIWVQLPQVPLLTVALWYKRLFDGRVRIIADCHNRILNPPWNKWPGLRSQLNACDAVVVHNDVVVPKVDAMGVRPDIVRVLEDPPALMRQPPHPLLAFPSPWVLFLASFNPDEPIEELLAAARLATEIHFVIAGDTGKARGRHTLEGRPPNVVFPGYLSGDTLDSAIASTNAILALTKLEDAQLSSAAEAIGAGRPMVLSDTPVTRTLYYQGGIFVDTRDPWSIADGCRLAVESEARLATEAVALRGRRLERWNLQASVVRALVTT